MRQKLNEHKGPLQLYLNEVLGMFGREHSVIYRSYMQTFAWRYKNTVF